MKNIGFIQRYQLSYYFDISLSEVDYMTDDEKSNLLDIINDKIIELGDSTTVKETIKNEMVSNWNVLVFEYKMNDKDERFKKVELLTDLKEINHNFDNPFYLWNDVTYLASLSFPDNIIGKTFYYDDKKFILKNSSVYTYIDGTKYLRLFLKEPEVELD